MQDDRPVDEEEFGEFIADKSDLDRAMIGDDEFSDFKEQEGVDSQADERNYEVLNDIRVEVDNHKQLLLTPIESVDAEAKLEHVPGDVIDLMSNCEVPADLNLSRIAGHPIDDSFKEFASQSFIESIIPADGVKSPVATTVTDDFAVETMPVAALRSLDDGELQEMDEADISAIKPEMTNLRHKKQASVIDAESLMKIAELDYSMPNVADISAPGPLDKDIEYRVMQDSVDRPAEDIAEDNEFSEEQDDARFESSTDGNLVVDVKTATQQPAILQILTDDGDRMPDSPVALAKDRQTDELGSAILEVNHVTKVDIKKPAKYTKGEIIVEVDEIKLEGKEQGDAVTVEADLQAGGESNEDDLFEDFKEDTLDKQPPASVLDSDSPVLRSTTAPKPTFALHEALQTADATGDVQESVELGRHLLVHHGPHQHQPDWQHQPDYTAIPSPPNLESIVTGGVDEEDDVEAGRDPKASHALVTPATSGDQPAPIVIASEQIQLAIDSETDLFDDFRDANDQSAGKVDEEEENLFEDDAAFHEATKIEQPAQVPAVTNRPAIMFDANQFDNMRYHLQNIAGSLAKDTRPLAGSSNQSANQRPQDLTSCKVFEGQQMPVAQHFEAMVGVMRGLESAGFEMSGEEKLNYGLHRKLMLHYWQLSVFNQPDYLDTIGHATAQLRDFVMPPMAEVNARVVSERWRRLSDDYLKSLPDYAWMFDN